MADEIREEIHEEHIEHRENPDLVRSKRIETAGRLLATVGLIILLILGAWGIIILAFDAPDFFSRISDRFGNLLGNSSSDSQQATTTPSTVPETLTVSAAPSTVASGSTVTFTWKDTDATGPRGFLISYACQEGLTLTAPLPTGTYRSIPCATPFNFTNAQDSVTLKPRLTGTSQQALVVTVSAISLATGTTTAAASASVTVSPESAPGPTPKPVSKPKPAVTTTKTYTSYRSSSPGPDLMVRIVAVGYINAAGGFVQLPPGANPYNYQYPQNTTMAVRFNIQNVGAATVLPGWQFSANVPPIDGLTTPYTYPSAPQPALTPGSGIVYTLKWSAPQQPVYCTQQTAYAQGYGMSQYPNPYCPQYGNSYSNVHGTVSVTADPAHAIPDYNWSNNSTSASF